VRSLRPLAAVSLVSAAAVLFFCTKSSPFYPINDWLDANCFLTVGKAMFQGQVLYRDIYEQKGPLVYFLYGLAAQVFPRSWLGVYLLEVLSGAVFLFFSGRTLLLLARPEEIPRTVYGRSLAAVPLLAALTFTSHAFYQGGGSVEEYALPVFALALYHLVRGLREKRELSLAVWLLHGLLAGCLLWMKYAVLGFSAAWCFVMVWPLLRRRRFGAVILRTAVFLGGMSLATLPWIGYFAANHALGDWLSAYVYHNIVHYQAAPLTAGKWLYNLATAAGFNVSLTGLGLLSLRFLRSRPAWRGWVLALPPLAYLAGAYLGARTAYSFLPMAVLTPLGLAALARWVCDSNNSRANRRDAGHGSSGPPAAALSRVRRSRRQAVLAAGLGLAVLLPLPWSFRHTHVRYARQDLPQVRFAQVIQADPRYPNLSLLDFSHLDYGFYQATGILPDVKYFCDLNIHFDEITQAQRQWLEEGRFDYVVCFDPAPRAMTKQPLAGLIASGRYRHVASASYVYERKERKFLLLARAGEGEEG
jgi:hypothetical protein